MRTSRTGVSQRRSEMATMEHVPIRRASVGTTILKAVNQKEGG